MSAIDSIRKNGQVSVSIAREHREEVIDLLETLKRTRPNINFSQLIVEVLLRGAYELRGADQTGAGTAGTNAGTTGE